MFGHGSGVGIRQVGPEAHVGGVARRVAARALVAEQVYTLSVPLVVDIGIAGNWADA